MGERESLIKEQLIGNKGVVDREEATQEANIGGTSGAAEADVEVAEVLAEKETN